MEKILNIARIVTAISAVFIAVKLWAAPPTVTRGDMYSLSELIKSKSITPEEAGNKRRELMLRLPLVYVQDGNVSCSID